MRMGVRERNNIHVSGRGSQPMLFAHGFGCDQHMWRFVVPAFEPAYKVVVFDHVGAGHSDTSAYDERKYSGLAGYAADVLEICRELNLQDVIFVGHSVAAMMGVLATATEPKWFAKLVLVGPSPRYLNDDDYVGGFSRADIDALLDALDSNYLGWSSTDGAGDHRQRGSSGARGGADQQLLPRRSRDRGAFRPCDIPLRQPGGPRRRFDPTLILQCAEDVIAPNGVGEFIHRQMPASRLVNMKATGHCPNLSAPAETIAAIQEFLAPGR